MTTKSEKVEIDICEIRSAWMHVIRGPNGLADGTLHQDFISDYLPEVARRMAECEPCRVYMVVEWDE